MQDIAKFWDKNAVKYAASPIRDMPAYEYTLERTRSYLRPTHRALELGCGTGTTALRLAPDVAEITGTDVSGEMIRIAREKAAAAGLATARFEAMPAEQAVRAATQPDVILGFNFFHLVPDADAIYAEIFRALPSGGLFISKTACLAEPSIGIKRFGFALLIPPMQLIGLAPPVLRYSFAGLEAAIAAAGFDVIETGRFPSMSRFVVGRKP